MQYQDSQSMHNSHHSDVPCKEDACGGKVQAAPIDALLRGSTVQGRSSLELDWDGLIVERRIAPPMDQEEAVLDQHHIVLFRGEPVVTEREYRPGKFTRLVKRPGMLSLGLAGRLPALRGRGPLDTIVCMVDPAAARRVVDESDQGGSRRLYEHMATADKALATLLDLAACEADEGGSGGRLYGDSLAYTIISRFLHIACFEGGKKIPDNPLPAPRLRRIMEKIEGEYHRDLSLAELADESGYSRAHFLRMFRAATGKTPHQYLRDFRLERAREQLQSGSASILEIALATGFASHSHLTQLFRQRFGSTPSVFRRNK
jgi:AraC family transcriptional regulator